MIVYPAIDLKGGACVRLYQGDLERATYYNVDPVQQARTFETAGAAWLHVVDLDGAFTGQAVNAAAIESIIAAVVLPVQVGGGIRDLGAIERWLSMGVARVVLGTVAVKNPALVVDACRLFPNRIAVALDAKGGRVAVEGWAELSEWTAVDLARRFAEVGVAAIVYTDVDRDGTKVGVNVEATADLARETNIPVIASGGVASIDDILALRRVETTGIAGVIIGRALYDGRVTLESALRAAA
ncbi:MAG: 1-(5-phosphoribosyl)-5-[(5-phosphoribosylamino)methylideneamino]imidazole-4-carboxamide isomerase [Alphaproteobacteria bacterium]|nr:1-(5-phosphoribosyl)-5-[(5-phosphoribosylamino)methylideneamino]imidazole-4-carboxamide isomerase [Alphaproteobacteria bacterium]